MATYGYLAVFLGTLVEGETVLLLGGYAAHRGNLSLPLVMVVAFAGSLLGDQTIFWIGHKYGRYILARWPGLKPRIARVQPLLNRFGNLFALIFRFFYGLRNVTPLAMAIGGFPPRRFLLLNTLGAGLWSAIVSTLGYLFGEAVQAMLPRMHYYPLVGLGAVGIAVALFIIIRRIKTTRRQVTPGRLPR